MKNLFKYASSFKIHFIAGPAFKLIEAIFELIIPLVMADIIDIGISQRDVPYILSKGALMLLFAFVGLSCSLICQWLASIASQGIGTELRNSLFAHISSLSYKDIDSKGSSSLVTRMTIDINQIQLAVAMLIRLAVRAPFLAIGAIVMAMLLDLKLSLIFLAIVPLVAVTLFFMMKKIVPYFKTIQKKLDDLALITGENLSGARVIRAFVNNKKEQERFEKASTELNQTAENAAKISALLSPVTSVILNFGIIAILFFGGFQVNTGALSQGQIIAFVNYMTQILLALVVVANLVLIFTRASVSISRINEIFMISPENSPLATSEKHKNDSVDNIKNNAKISFNNVSFSYDNSSKKVLSDISFNINTGDTIGIIGATGSGKSTLVSLIAGFYNACSGEIYIDKQKISDIPLDILRKKIGFVPQKASLLSGSVAENICMGKQDASEKEIEDSLRIAQAYDFVMKKNLGLNYYIEEGGKNMSGGQKQRLTIARAIVGKPEILILDDSSSALDYATDEALRKALKTQINSNRTTIIVSQRIVSVKDCDRIFVLSNGKLCGNDLHKNLLSYCEEYKEMYISQGYLL